jgi:hypothetical protein
LSLCNNQHETLNMQSNDIALHEQSSKGYIQSNNEPTRDRPSR